MQLDVAYGKRGTRDVNNVIALATEDSLNARHPAGTRIAFVVDHKSTGLTGIEVAKEVMQKEGVTVVGFAQYNRIKSGIAVNDVIEAISAVNQDILSNGAGTTGRVFNPGRLKPTCPDAVGF